MWVARGQCLVQHGAGEAYLPVLEALGQLCRRPGGALVIAARQSRADLAGADAGAARRRGAGGAAARAHGATRERMLRELAEALEALTAEQPLVLVLEDLHWSDCGHGRPARLSGAAAAAGPALADRYVPAG